MRCVNLTVTLIDDRNLHYKEEEEGGNVYEVEAQNELDPLRLMTIRRLDYWINQAVLLQQEEFTRLRKQLKLRCGLDDLRTLGLHLFELLFNNARIRKRFLDQYLRVTTACQTDPNLRLRLHLVFEKPTEKLAALPWEFLMVAPDSDPEHGVFMAGERTELLLTRRIKVPDFVQTLGRQAKLVILLAVCQPDLIDGLKMGAIDTNEVDEIKSALNGLAEAANWITVEPLIDPTYAELDAAIQKHKPTILHYVGHGRAGDISLRRAKDDDNYDIEDPKKQYRWVTADEVKKLFTEHKPSIVFLSACKGAAPIAVEGYKSTARELIHAGVPGVVAMQYNIGNEDAKQFAHKFYEAVGKGLPIDEAVKSGRRWLGDLPPKWVHPRFATPVVYLQSTDPLVDPPAMAAQVPPAAPAAEQQVGAVAPRPRTETPPAPKLAAASADLRG
jgi:hypothetical protein